MEKATRITVVVSHTKRRIVFVGIGSSYWAARFSELLWREYVNPDCTSLQSYVG